MAIQPFVQDLDGPNRRMQVSRRNYPGCVIHRQMGKVTLASSRRKKFLRSEDAQETGTFVLVAAILESEWAAIIAIAKDSKV